jgi:hypothetical protein
VSRSLPLLADIRGPKRRANARATQAARWLGLTLLHLLVALAAALWLIHASPRAEGAVQGNRRTITAQVTPSGRTDVRVEAVGACGATCGIDVRWISSANGRVVDRARGIVAYLEVERDVPMLASIEIRDRTGVIGRGGKRFVYDGQVRSIGEVRR